MCLPPNNGHHSPRIRHNWWPTSDSIILPPKHKTSALYLGQNFDDLRVGVLYIWGGLNIWAQNPRKAHGIKNYPKLFLLPVQKKRRHFAPFLIVEISHIFPPTAETVLTHFAHAYFPCRLHCEYHYALVWGTLCIRAKFKGPHRRLSIWGGGGGAALCVCFFL